MPNAAATIERTDAAGGDNMLPPNRYMHGGDGEDYDAYEAAFFMHLESQMRRLDSELTVVVSEVGRLSLGTEIRRGTAAGQMANLATSAEISFGTQTPTRPKPGLLY